MPRIIMNMRPVLTGVVAVVVPLVLAAETVGAQDAPRVPDRDVVTLWQALKAADADPRGHRRPTDFSSARQRGGTDGASERAFSCVLRGHAEDALKRGHLWGAAYEFSRCLHPGGYIGRDTAAGGVGGDFLDALADAVDAADEGARNRAMVRLLRFLYFVETGGGLAW